LDQVGFIFETGPDDPATTEILWDWHAHHPEVRCFEVSTLEVPHSTHPEGRRHWTHEKYAHMAELRNRLLDRAICYEPTRYLSLDSDVILEDPTTISQLFKLTEALDAVAPLTYMTPQDDGFPNVMTWHPATGPGTRAARLGPYPKGIVFKADVIMAAVMMSEPVYRHTRYSMHPQGEDLGWAASCYRHHFGLWSASHIYASHVMYESMLEDYLRDGDSRSGVLHLGLVETPAAGAVVVGSQDA
jgi:hypothetical protein